LPWGSIGYGIDVRKRRQNRNGDSMTAIPREVAGRGGGVLYYYETKPVCRIGRWMEIELRMERLPPIDSICKLDNRIVAPVSAAENMYARPLYSCLLRNKLRPLKMGKTLYDKIYFDHLVNPEDTQYPLLYVDAHLVFEVTSPQAFESIKAAGRKVRRPDLSLATVDHNVPTDDRATFRNAKTFIKQSDSRNQVLTLEQNVKENGIVYFGMSDRRQGIVHVMAPEQGFTLPGTVLVCGDSHTSTHGAFGALAIGIGTSEVEHVLATQTLPQTKAKNMRVRVEGTLLPGVFSKDIILHLIGTIGTNGAKGHVIEYCGSTIDTLSMEARMVMCNMSCEAGARASLIAPDEKTFEYLKGKPMAPKGESWDQAMTFWKSLYSDQDAVFEVDIMIQAQEIAPTVTWGTSPDQISPITGFVPDPKDYRTQDHIKAANIEKALQYMDLQPGVPLTSIKIDRVFIGSCTNSRIEDLRAAAMVLKGRKVAPHVSAMIVPGSGLVRYQAEKEGIDIIFKDAGFDWREAGCSMCLGMNPDILLPGQRCASTSNRNYEGRQGPGGRTHLCSPAMAAAAAISGHLADVREFLPEQKALPIPIAYPVTNFSIVDNPDDQDYSHELEGQASNQKFSTTFTVLKGIAVPLAIENVNTGLLMMSKYLKIVKRTGLGEKLFYEIRYDPVTGDKVTTCPLNQEPWNNAKILVNKGPNFGVGSSREHAVWGLLDFGIKCIVAPSFGDLFASNCLRNGLLPITVSDPNNMARIYDEANGKRSIEIDLPNQVIRNHDSQVLASFDIDPFRKHCLLNGLDDIELTLKNESKITAFEQRQQNRCPWLFGRSINLLKNTSLQVAQDVSW
jgi:3-isopropylmalate dehydratase